MKRKISRHNVTMPPELSSREIAKAESRWLLAAQLHLVKEKTFPMWKKQFGLYLDDEGLWRCRGRLENAALLIAARHPVLLPKYHSLTVLVIRDAHERLMHNGVRETVAEIRSKYWGGKLYGKYCQGV